MSKRWTTLETAGRFMFALSVAFLIVGVILTAVGFTMGGPTGSGSVSPGTLAMQIAGPVCLATTGVMWALGVAFSRLWRAEWRRRQQAMELRARVQLHALAMDLLKKPILSPRILHDPVLRRQLLVKLRQQSAMDVRSVYARCRVRPGVLHRRVYVNGVLYKCTCTAWKRVRLSEVGRSYKVSRFRILAPSASLGVSASTSA
jgi:hypothetical protein